MNQETTASPPVATRETRIDKRMHSFPLPRVNVHVDRHGNPKELHSTIKVSSKKALKKTIQAARRDGNSALARLSRTQYNRLLRKLLREYKKLGRVRELLTELVGDLLGLFFIERVRDDDMGVAGAIRPVCLAITVVALTPPPPLTGLQFLPSTKRGRFKSAPRGEWGDFPGKRWPGTSGAGRPGVLF